MNTGFMAGSLSHPMTTKLASVFRKLSFSVPKKLVANSGTNDLRFMQLTSTPE